MTTFDSGLNIIFPVINRVTHKVSILKRWLDPDNISVITRDNLEIHLSTAAFFLVVDPAMSVYRTANANEAIKTTVTSIVRSTGGQMEFDEVPSRRDFNNQKIRESLTEACVL